MLEFNGECFIPGQANKRLEQDHLERYRFASQFVDGKRVLDIACGSGYGSRMLLDAGAECVTGVDISTSAVAYALDRFGHSGVSYVQGRIDTFASDEPYDMIVCYETIEHVSHYQRALVNLHSLLKDDGTLLISSPNRYITSPLAVSLRDRPSNPHHVQEFLLHEFVEALGTAGFAVNEEDVLGQRCQPRIDSLVLRKWYRKIMRPHQNSCPSVKSLHGRVPRYFVAVVKKL